MKFTLDSPLDMHIHFREGDMMRQVAPLSAADFAGGVIMPNTISPIDTLEKLTAYREEIRKAVAPEIFEPYMTLFMKPFSDSFIKEAAPHIIGIKLYPAGITTNSEGGIGSLEQAYPTFAAMEKAGVPLLIHGETDGFVMDREAEFITLYDDVARSFPNLTIIMEHITTRAAVDFLDRYPNIHATITLHHLLITLDDLAGGLLDPHLFCKPIAKRPGDRDALLRAALSAHPKVMFGSDSAPHPRHKKECCGCAAGIFTAPVALPMLAELFESHDALENLQAFVSDNAARIYGITPREKTVTLVKRDGSVPDTYGEIVPFRAGTPLSWDIEG